MTRWHNDLFDKMIYRYHHLKQTWWHLRHYPSSNASSMNKLNNIFFVYFAENELPVNALIFQRDAQFR